jgi:hypothetical protein
MVLFLQFFWSAPVLGGRRILCTSNAKSCEQAEDFLTPYSSDRCVGLPVSAWRRRAPLGVDLINPEMNYSTDIVPATSWPLPQARLAVDLGGPNFRGLFEDDLPRAVSSEADAGAAVVVGKSVAVERAGALQVVNNNRGGVAEQIDLNLSPLGVVKLVAGREDHSHDYAAVGDLAVRPDVNVFGGHQPVHGGAVVFEPRRVPGFSELVDFFTQRRFVHGDSSAYRMGCYSRRCDPGFYFASDDISVGCLTDHLSGEEDKAQSHTRCRNREFVHRVPLKASNESCPKKYTIDRDL